MVTKEHIDKVAVVLVEKLVVENKIELQKTSEWVDHHVNYKTASGVGVEVTRDYDRRTREHVVVIRVGGRGWGRRTNHGFTDRDGKGYDWKAIVAKITHLSEQYVALRKQNMERQAIQVRHEARLARLAEEFHIPMQPERGEGVAVSHSYINEETLDFAFKLHGLSEERMCDVLARLASVGLLISA